MLLTLVCDYAGPELLNILVRDELPGSEGKKGNEQNLQI